MAGFASLLLCMNGLLEHANDVKVFCLKEDSLAEEISSDCFLLLLYWFGPAINFLEKNLHEVGLANTEIAQLSHHFHLLVLLCVTQVLR